MLYCVFFLKLIHLFYLFLVCWIFVAARRLSLLFTAVCGLLPAVASLVAEHGL